MVARRNWQESSSSSRATLEVYNVESLDRTVCEQRVVKRQCSGTVMMVREGKTAGGGGRELNCNKWKTC